MYIVPVVLLTVAWNVTRFFELETCHTFIERNITRDLGNTTIAFHYPWSVIVLVFGNESF